ncbi:MAG: 5-dehydro-4-deoxy-D-glucuronate isomerase [Desulfobacterales bacterium]|nr:MAG: 5-dehydro-4-deoxy-D-glucuronate isomerase [Desulfobacterales bacterium]
MEIRYPSNPDDFQGYSTDRIRSEFLLPDLFTRGRMALTYSHFDRMVIGGICPTDPLPLKAGKELGTEYFLERREMGLINVGPAGKVSVDGRNFELDKTDGLYIGKNAKEVVFTSLDPENPARFYMLSGPAHKDYPTVKITKAETDITNLGTSQEANVRVIYKYIHPDGVQSCQLVMGMTVLESGSVWNSMPCHTHERRMEVYFYFDLAPGAVMLHLMGKPDETRHLVMRNEEAVISPSWSIHAGAGTSSYSFIWGMLGDNQTFSDMDAVDLANLK